MDALASSLGLDKAYVEAIVTSASYRYREYHIPKRSGGYRQIHHPSAELKALQRWVASSILPLLPVHAAAYGYVRGRNILHNASLHVRSRFLLRLDFKDFFHSLTASDIHEHLRQFSTRLPKGWSPLDNEALVKIVSRHDRLTIGAVTSPSLSNSLCYPLDERLATHCAELAITYSRYADDLVFTTNAPDLLGPLESHVAKLLGELAYPKMLSLNPRKTQHLSKRYRRVVTGLTLTSEGRVSLGRARKRLLRSSLYKFDSLDDRARRKLAGWLAYTKAVEPDFLNALILKYGFARVHQARKMSQ